MKLLAFVGMLLMAMLSAGCCFFLEPPPPPPPNAAEVVLEASSTVAIKEVWVHQEGEALVIQGTLHPRSFVQKDAGHVDVRIVNAEEKRLRELKIAPDEAVFRKETGKVSPFSAVVGLVIPPDARVCLRAHAGPAESCTRIR